MVTKAKLANSVQDIIDVKGAIIGEFRRRGNIAYQNDYSVVPMKDGGILLEHFKKILEDIYALDSTKDWRDNVTVPYNISASNLKEPINYIKQLMNTVVGKP